MLLDRAQIDAMRAHQAEMCEFCAYPIVLAYCRDHDEYFLYGHFPTCPRMSSHEGVMSADGTWTFKECRHY
jgi:hypothetical protein